MKKIYVKLIALLFISITFFWSCQPEGKTKIMFIGVDGLDWELLDKLIAERSVPSFMKLTENGASAKVNTNDKGGSAVYWTTIATGQLSSKHGIKNFITVDPTTKKRVPVTSNTRKSKAFWNILSEHNISVGVVGWYVTWPAEKVNGFMVSSYFGIKDVEQPTWKGTIYANTPHMVFPSELQEEVDGYIQKAEQRYLQNLQKIIKPSALKKNYGVIKQIKWVFLTDEIFHEAGLNLYRQRKPRVFAVYFEGVDAVGHRFTFTKSVRQKQANRRFGNVQKKYYLYTDKLVEQYLKAADKNTVIIIASDHGLMRGHHTNNGVFIISGPGIKKNFRCLKPINLTDMLPTMLYILGLPIAKDMDGQPFLDAFEEDYLAQKKVQYIRTYGKQKKISNFPTPSELDEKILERLKSLGYIK